MRGEREREDALVGAGRVASKEGSGVWVATPYRQVESPQNKVSFFFFFCFIT